MQFNSTPSPLPTPNKKKRTARFFFFHLSFFIRLLFALFFVVDFLLLLLLHHLVLRNTCTHKTTHNCSHLEPPAHIHVHGFLEKQKHIIKKKRTMSLLYYKRPDYVERRNTPMAASDYRTYLERQRASIPPELCFEYVMSNRAVPVRFNLTSFSLSLCAFLFFFFFRPFNQL